MMALALLFKLLGYETLISDRTQKRMSCPSKDLGCPVTMRLGLFDAGFLSVLFLRLRVCFSKTNTEQMDKQLFEHLLWNENECKQHSHYVLCFNCGLSSINQFSSFN